MEFFQEQFLSLAIAKGALKFGEFTLKSGRLSPYFFNAGKFSTGRDLSILGQSYASAIVESGIQFDILFGPAYKGIPLAAATAVALAEHHGMDVPFCFNRKEAKSHGEGGTLVGAPLEGRILIIDDVITAGTAIREVMSIIAEQGAEAAGVVIGLDRKEKGKQEKSAVQEVESEYQVKVTSIIAIDQIIAYLEAQGAQDDIITKIRAYRSQYGV